MRAVGSKDLARAARMALSLLQGEKELRVPLLMDEVAADDPDAGPVLMVALAWLAGQVTISRRGHAGAKEYLLAQIARLQDEQ